MTKQTCGWCGKDTTGHPFKDCYECRMKIKKGAQRENRAASKIKSENRRMRTK